jgi:hypothetical protein
MTYEEDRNRNLKDASIEMGRGHYEQRKTGMGYVRIKSTCIN